MANPRFVDALTRIIYTTRMLDRMGKLQIAASILAVAVVPVVMLVQCYRSPDVAFISGDAHAKWIAYPMGVVTWAHTADARHPLSAVFVTEFDADRPGAAVLHIRALRAAKVFLNDQAVAVRFPANWKEYADLDITGYLRPGRNTIRVRVSNLMGPPLLDLWVDGLGWPLATDETWVVTLGAPGGMPTMYAVSADDTLPHPDSLTLATPLASARDNWPLLLGAFVASSAAFLLRTRFPRSVRSRLPLVAAIGITAAWVLVFANAMRGIGLIMGFDADAHMEYIAYILDQHRIPLANEGWSMYHPPLYYLLAALGRVAAGATGLKAVAFVSGMGCVWLTYAVARRVFQGDAVKTFFAVLVAGTIPMSIYISAYVSNESTNAFFCGLATLVAIGAVYEPKGRTRTFLGLGAAIGLALLCKFTALLITPLLLIVVAWKLRAVERVTLRRSAQLIGLALLVALALSGWFYVRNWIHFGNPLQGNWQSTEGDLGWWQQPGFHTARYYLSFGDSVAHPFLSACRSYWDALYSTFWGDGLVGGVAEIGDRHPQWNYDLMSIVYLLAVPATVLMVWGGVKAIRESLRGEDAAHRLAMWLLVTEVVVVGGAMLYVTTRLPYYGQAKAFYGLPLAMPLSILAALALGSVDSFLKRKRLTPLRAVLYGWLGTLTALIFLSFGLV